LVVQGVHLARIAAQDRVEPAALNDVHRLLRQHSAHPRRLHVDLVDVGVQRAAERDVDHLRAAADAEDRQAERQGPFEQLKLELVAFRVDAHVGHDFTAV
jgi:hypothetical protein